MKKIILLLFILSTTVAFSQNKKLDSMLVYLPTAKNDTNKILLLDEISYEYTKTDLDKAKQYAKDEIELAKKIGNKKFEARSYDALGTACQYAGDVDVALDYYMQALRLKEQLNDKKGIATSLYDIAGIYKFQNDFEKSLEYTLMSLKSCEEAGFTKGKAFALSQLGNIYADMKDHIKAIEYHEKAVATGKEMSDKIALAHLSNNLALELKEIKNYKKAIVMYKEGLAIFEEANDTNSMAAAVINIGSAYRDYKKYDSALLFIQQGLKYAIISGNREWRLNAYINMINLLEDLKDYKTEVRYLTWYTELKDSMFNKDRINAISEMQTKYETEKKEAENISLLQQNEIQSLKINNNYYTIASLVGLLVISVVIAFLIFSQNKLRFQQRTGQLEQRLLRSQMNPHFIFNSLQAIQNFISDKKAIKYLSSFGALTRSILENSRLESIPLSKEIKLLENYLELQKLLHEQQFNYVINVAPDLDPEEINIPPMLSQPFIENAVEYGMRDIDNGGLIEISFSATNDTLFLEIKDNGMGLSIDKDKKHMSLATTITKERISLFNRKRSQKASFNITEAYPTAIRKGVMVNFSIPI